MIPDPADTRQKGIDQIVRQVSRLSRESKHADIWEEVFKPAKGAILEMELTDDEKLRAIAQLTEAMRV